MNKRIIPTISGMERRFPGIGPPSTFWSLKGSLRAVRVLVVYHSACWCVTMSVPWSIGLEEDEYSTILDLVGSDFPHILWPCLSFKGYALTPSLLFHLHWLEFPVPYCLEVRVNILALFLTVEENMQFFTTKYAVGFCRCSLPNWGSSLLFYFSKSFIMNRC